MNDSGTTESGQLSLRRLERVSDIVHAVALLALLLTMQFFPSGLADEEVLPFWLGQWESWLGFVVGFLVIGYYWISNQQYFSYYARTDKGHTWLELLYLIGIATMPLGNQAISVLPGNYLALITVSLEIIFVGVMQYFAWAYATKGDRLIRPGSLDAATRSAMSKAALLMPAAGAVAGIAALLYPPLWYVVLIVGPVLLSIGKKQTS